MNKAEKIIDRRYTSYKLALKRAKMSPRGYAAVLFRARGHPLCYLEPADISEGRVRGVKERGRTRERERGGGGVGGP